MQPQFIALHLTKEINVYFVCLKSTNSIKGMTDELPTQELVHTFNHTCGRNPPWKTDCAPHQEWCQNPLPSTGTRTGQISKCSKASPGLELARKFQHLLQDPDFCCACKNALSGRAHIYKDPLLQRAASWIQYPAENILDPTKNSFIPVVIILLSLSNVQAWAKVTTENGQSCCNAEGWWQFGCVFPMHKYGKLQNSLMSVI